MNELDHWHPVLLSGELKEGPALARACGQEIVVFRSGDGVGALPNRCAHRGMPLHRGHVAHGRVVCPYHGWRWSPDGTATTPGGSNARACGARYEAVERMGAVWVKNPSSAAAFPRVDFDGFYEFNRSRHRAKAPVELVVDNFIEVEHTPSVHAVLGYPLERLREVTCRVTALEDRVRVYNVGPQRELPWPLGKLYGVPRGALFVDDWTVYFSPLHAVYEQYFLDGHTRRRVGDPLRIAVFFTPVNERETDLFVFAYGGAHPLGAMGLNLARMVLTRALVRLEVSRDAALLGAIGDGEVTLKGHALGRFDKALSATRKRIERIYRGRAV